MFDHPAGSTTLDWVRGRWPSARIPLSASWLLLAWSMGAVDANGGGPELRGWGLMVRSAVGSTALMARGPESEPVLDRVRVSPCPTPESGRRRAVGIGGRSP